MDRLISAIRRTGNPTVAGLDPRLSYIPDYLLDNAFNRHGATPTGAAAAILEFNKGLIDALFDVVPAVKPQCAYYEAFGWEGVKAFDDTVHYAQEKGMYVIIDGKRNDIGPTMQAYATGHLGMAEIGGNRFPAFSGDALTVNGYLGTDGIRPLLAVCEEFEKDIFVLVKTSNPSSGELQDQLLSDGRTVYRAMGELCETWGKSTGGKFGYYAVGAVVGATYPAQLKELRAALPRTFFLVPGYGAQGAGAEDVAPAFDEKGMGAIVNSSRAILCAWKNGDWSPVDYAQAARAEAIRMRDEIMRALA